MTPQNPSGLSDEEIIERIATEVMGREKKERPWNEQKDIASFKGPWWLPPKRTDGTYYSVKIWNPLTDWNHWRQVEEKVMEDEYLFGEYLDNICNEEDDNEIAVMKADLPTRCKALLAALSSHS
jgi:hypothetical protein